MKIGDKVRFLNDVGGGVVRGFKGKDLALVEDGDGFEIPVLIRECVVIDPAYDIQSKQEKPEIKKVESYEDSLPEREEEEDFEIIETANGDEINLLLGFVAKDLKNMNSTEYYCYLVNDSNYFISFSYLTKSPNGWVVKTIDTIEPNIKLQLFELNKEEINDIQQSCFQFFAYKENKAFDLKNGGSIEMRIDPIKFYKLHSFKNTEYFKEPAILYQIIERDTPPKKIEISAQEIKEAIQSKNSDKKDKKQTNKQSKKIEVIEIDLHINELIDNTNGLSASDMLEYQMEKFREVMNDNKNNKGQKVVFIHGKGNGVLKTEIYKVLKSEYKLAYFQDASFREYGYGATMVTIK